MMRNLFYLVLILTIAISAVFAYSYNALSKDEKQEKINPKQNNNPNVQVDYNTTLETQAWIYPGEPACNAMNEIQDGRKINILKPEYFTVLEDGIVTLLTEEDYGCNAYSKKNLEIIKKYSDKQFITVSSDGESMRKLFSNSENTDNAINLVTEFSTENDVDGIEIDFEDFSSWTQEDYGNYLEFAKNLKNQLNMNNKALMLDGPPLTESTQIHFKWNYKDFSDSTYADLVVIMAYDYQYDFGSGEPIAPNEWIKETYEHALSQINSSDKLVLGIPSYGYTGIKGDYRAKILTKNQILALVVEEHGATMETDSYEMQLSINDEFYSYYDTIGLRKKLLYIESLDVKKISIWHLGGNDWF